MSDNVRENIKRLSIVLVLTDYDDYALVRIGDIKLTDDMLYTDLRIAQVLSLEGIDRANVNRVMKIEFIQDPIIFCKSKVEYLDEESRDNLTKRKICATAGRIEIRYQYSKKIQEIAFGYEEEKSAKSIVYKAIKWRMNYEH